MITSDSALPGLEELVDRGPVLSEDFVIILGTSVLSHCNFGKKEYISDAQFEQ